VLAMSALPPEHIFAGLPAHNAGAILVDVPWRFLGHTPEVIGNRDPRRHFRTMTLAEIYALPVRDIAARDCHLFFWITGPFLPRAFEVIKAWGFKYSAVGCTWVKLKKNCRVLTSESDFHFGCGYTTRKNTETCLLARRGNARRISKEVRELIVAPRREHSRKPDEIYERIEQYCHGPFVELFSRSSRCGWSSWGDEAGKFDPVPARRAA
jgi:N6-adenosine-specific RNA methylase IME4